ncbi:MAG: c-type cytochrome [Magnetococcales bacterium]|nr:c-type cytochrome [Magnetococcales bacterium]
MKTGYCLLPALGLVLLFATGSSRADIIDDGEAVFKKCNVCHNLIDDGSKKVGPNLGGVIGRKAGTLKGYTFSPAMTASGIVWNRESLDRFLTKPTAVVPNTQSTFPGLAEPTERSAVISFLEALAES